MDERKLEFQVEICTSATKYDVTPIFDRIKTLEGTHAGLPYGSTSGNWGDSGKRWTEQHGTLIGADITYYSRYEDIYYHLDIDFSKEKIKDYMERAYSRKDDNENETKEYKRLGRGYKSGRVKAYDSFSTLVFGFAPKGMVIVWLNFGNTRIELDRYQAKVINDHAEIAKAKEKYLQMYRISPERYEEANKELSLPNASSLEWDN